MRNYILMVIGLILLVGCNSGTIDKGNYEEEETKAVYRTINPDEALEKMNEEGVIIIDVREGWEFAEGHVVDAELLPLGQVKAGELDLIPDKDQVILIYCRSGNRSGQAADILVGLGYSNVYDFGGIIDWPYEVVK